jgi:hypothetical protein
MDSREQAERESPSNSICRLEWIALAMEAARRYKEREHAQCGTDPDPPERTAA